MLELRVFYRDQGWRWKVKPNDRVELWEETTGKYVGELPGSIAVEVFSFYVRTAELQAAIAFRREPPDVEDIVRHHVRGAELQAAIANGLDLVEQAALAQPRAALPPGRELARGAAISVPPEKGKHQQRRKPLARVSGRSSGPAATEWHDAGPEDHRGTPEFWAYNDKLEAMFTRAGLPTAALAFYGLRTLPAGWRLVLPSDDSARAKTHPSGRRYKPASLAGFIFGVRATASKPPRGWRWAFTVVGVGRRATRRATGSARAILADRDKLSRSVLA